MPLRVVPSSTLSSNRCLGIAFLSRADREIAVFRHVAPPSRLRLEFPRETASSEVRGEGREPLADKAGESTHRSRSEGEKGLQPAFSKKTMKKKITRQPQMSLKFKKSLFKEGKGTRVQLEHGFVFCDFTAATQS